MTSVTAMAIASVVVLAAPILLGQEVLRYRDIALESTVASVVKISGASVADLKTPHQRPAKIQELEWRAPYASSANGPADPVRHLQFSFYDDQLYQVVVTYDRDRIEGLTNADVIESLTATYGAPSSLPAKTATTSSSDGRTDVTAVAQWDNATSLLTLARGTYTPELQLVMISKTLSARARVAIKEAVRLDTQEAPQRELAQRNKEAEDSRAASQKARVANRAAFRP